MISRSMLGRKLQKEARRKALSSTGIVPRAKMKRHQVTRKTSKGSTTYWRGSGAVQAKREHGLTASEIEAKKAAKREVRRRTKKYKLKHKKINLERQKKDTEYGTVIHDK